MKLRRLEIDRLAGFDRPVEIQKIGEGLNIILGPNGIGKSRLSAAVRALLWSERGTEVEGLSASALFEHEGAGWRVVRDGSLHLWQRDGIDADAPPLPSEHLDGCFFLGLRDLLGASDQQGPDVAIRIRRQMSGGFDLDAVKERFASSVLKRPGTKEAKDLTAADSEIRRAEGMQLEVQRREEQLDSLRSQAGDADAARDRLAHYDKALRLQALRGDLSERESGLAGLPEALAGLDGKEVERLDKLDDAIAGKRRDRDSALRALEDFRRAAAETRLLEPIAPAVLATWRERAERFADLERQLVAASLDASATRDAARASREPLGDRDQSAEDLESAPAIEGDFDLFHFLRESRQLESEREALTDRLNLLTARKFSDRDTRRLELLRRSVEPLRAWLRAPDPELRGQGAESATIWPSRKVVIGVGLVVALLSGVSLPVVATLVPLVGVGFGVGLVAMGLFSRVQIEERDAVDLRGRAEAQFAELMDAPQQWAAEGVAELLRQLEDELARLDADQKRSRDRAVERGQLEESVAGLELREADLTLRRTSLSERLGLSTPAPDIEMVDLARALDAARAAHLAAVSATGHYRELEALRHRQQNEIAVFLSGLDEEEPADSAAARAGVHSLEQRDATLRASRSNALREEESRERIESEVQALVTDRSEMFRVAGLSSNERGDLIRLLNDLDRFRALTSQHADLASQIKRMKTELVDGGESALTLRDRAQLEEERSKLQKKSKDLTSLLEQIAEISQSALSAREGHQLEEAIDRRKNALVALRDRRDEALASRAGEFLVDVVRREHETNQMPRVLERARSHFAAFTHQRYELEVTPNGGGAFVAIDAESGEGLSTAKLSDGTRAQLILAARLAFAEEAEQGANLPLFLDEALAHSDPDRFHAIARSLAKLVAEDERQVFYLSNDPNDVARFEAAFEVEGCSSLCCIDLGELRGQAARVDGPGALEVAALPSVPRPAGMSAENYGAKLGVSPLDPSRDAFGQHLYYVLRDDLSLLYEFLQARIETVGQCRNLVKGGSPAAREFALKSDVGHQLEARIELLEVFCLAWREGRGEKVGRLAIEQSGAVTGKYIDAVAEVAEELDGDATRLLAALRASKKDPRLSGFRTKSIEDIESFFIDRGHLDERPILVESQIVERAIGTPAANQLSPKLAASLVHLWWGLSERRAS